MNMAPMETPERELNYLNLFWLTTTPVLSIVGVIWYWLHNGFPWANLLVFTLMYLATGLSITAGYHRYYSHRSYECGKGLQLFYLIFGAAAAQNSVLNWASDHRDHHRYVDGEKDPYNIGKGFFYAHMGWIFYTDPLADERKKNAPDLTKDPLVLWQDRWYPFLVVAVSFGLPTFLGLLMGHPLGGFLWGGLFRMVVVHHMTFLINSAAHVWGGKPYSMNNSARDNCLLAPLTFGEGYHNFHHKFPADWRNGIRWHQFDITKWWLWATQTLGLTSKLKSVPEPLILKARLEVEMEKAKQKLSMDSSILEKAQEVLENGRESFLLAMERYQKAKTDYSRAKRYWSVTMRREIRNDIRKYSKELANARRSWNQAMDLVNRFPYSYSGAKSIVLLTALADIFKSR